MTQSFDCQSDRVMIIFNDPIRIGLAQITGTAPAAQCGLFSLLLCKQASIARNEKSPRFNSGGFVTPSGFKPETF